MHKQWMGCNQTNFASGRGGCKPEAVVLHRTGGSLQDIDGRCNQAGTFSSAHYAVGSNAEVHQYVEETDTAYHAGVVVNPLWLQLNPGKNPNLYTIGVEIEGNAGAAISSAHYDAIASLISEIVGRWQIPLDSNHLVLHSEIRAGRICPGDGFDRQEVLNRLKNTPSEQMNMSLVASEVGILRNSNIREGKPITTARIVRIACANTNESVTGFTDQGERVQGNSYWYRTEDGNFLWAGATNKPNPAKSEQPQPIALPTAVQSASTTGSTIVAAQSGIPRIDRLFLDGAEPLITAHETDANAIGAVQDLLTGLGFAGLPTLLSTAYGVPGPKTLAAIGSFRQQNQLGDGTDLDAATLHKMVSTPAKDPRASTAYMALVLGFEATNMQKILSMVSQMEGAGKFAALNLNTDRAGLSFGVLQWAQRPGRLPELLNGMCAADRDQFVTVFGSGDSSIADGLIVHCLKPSGGVDPSTGHTLNPSFDLVAEPWVSRFRQAALIARFQQVQIQLAFSCFQKSYAALQRFAADLCSERAVAFMIDVANQFGDGGAAKLYADVYQPGMTEPELLEEIANLTVERVGDAFKAGVRARRDQYLHTSLLNDQPFTGVDQARTAGVAS